MDHPSDQPAPDPLTAVVHEVEAHVAADGWDQPPRLFALARTAEIARAEPALAAALGLGTDDPNALTPVEQDEFPTGPDLDRIVATLAWPPDVVGAVLVVERTVLPPSAEADLPEEPTAQAAAAARHPSRREVRMAVGVTRPVDRTGPARCCVLRVRGEEALVSGPDLVPALTEALTATFDD